MAGRSQWGLAPRQSIEAECARRGTSAVVSGCVRLIRGDYSDAGLIMALGGPGASRLLDGRPHADDYWFRVWGIRGLLWAWDDSAADAVIIAMGDASWRVRELAAKVIARHLLGDALAAVADLLEDPVPRVRTAAHRAISVLTQTGA